MDLLLLSRAEYETVSEHVRQLRQLAATHRELATVTDSRSGRSAAKEAAQRTDRLATLIEKLMRAHYRMVA